MGKKTQGRFEHFAFDSSGFNLHKHDTPVDELIVFIHGLGGAGVSTWGEFPALTFDNYGRADVALFDYETAPRRLKRGRLNVSNVSSYVDQLLGRLEEVQRDGYERIHLVGHSLGGVVADMVAMRLIQKHFSLSNDPLCRVGSVIYLSSPRLGSRFASGSLEWLIGEFRVLKLLSDPTYQIDRFYSDYVEAFLGKVVNMGMVHVPRFACVGGDDRYVNVFSTTVGIPRSQCLHLQETHKSICKPVAKDDPQFKWLIECILSTSTARQVTRERYSHGQRREARRRTGLATLVTEYWGASSGPWEEAFHEARLASSTADVKLEDKRELEYDARTDLIVSVSDSRDIIGHKNGVRDQLSRAIDRVHAEHQLTAGLATVGPGSKTAQSILQDWVDDSGGATRVAIAGAPSNPDLKQVIGAWMSVLVKRRAIRIEAQRGPRSEDATMVTGLETIGEI